MARDKLKMAMDANGQPLQGALCPRKGDSQNVVVAGASAVSTEITDAEVVRLYSTTDCHIRFGDFATVAAVATDMFLPKNLPEYFNLRGNRWIAVIQDSAGGTLNIQVMF
jgi:hypothetical protein